MTTKGENMVRAALLGVSLLALVYGFKELIFEDMSFGWYVPIFSAYVVWRERRELMASLGEPSLAGLAAALAALFVGFLGVRGVQIRFEIVAFAALLVAVPWAMYGRRAAARLAFPAAFLLFCIPLATFLDVVTVHLRLLASAVAAAILEGVGAAVERVGTTITTSGGFAIDVAAPCAGLRSIFALLALGGRLRLLRARRLVAPRGALRARGADRSRRQHRARADDLPRRHLVLAVLRDRLLPRLLRLRRLPRRHCDDGRLR